MAVKIKTCSYPQIIKLVKNGEVQVMWRATLISAVGVSVVVESNGIVKSRTFYLPDVYAKLIKTTFALDKLNPGVVCKQSMTVTVQRDERGYYKQI